MTFPLVLILGRTEEKIKTYYGMYRCIIRSNIFIFFLSQWYDVTEIPLREKKLKSLPRSDGCGLTNFDGMQIPCLNNINIYINNINNIGLCLVKEFTTMEMFLLLATD